MRFLSGRRSRPGWRERRDYWWKVCSRRAYGATYVRWALRAAAISFFILSLTLWLVGLFLGTRADRALSLARRRLPDNLSAVGQNSRVNSGRSDAAAQGTAKTHPAVYCRALVNSTAGDGGWKFFSCN